VEEKMIPAYKKILVATDLTPNAECAFRHAVAMARCHHSEITLLHVLPQVDQAVLNYVSTVMGSARLADLEVQHEAEVIDSIRQRIAEFAKDELRDYPEDLQRIAAVEVHHGDAVAMILETADRLEVDMIVLGSHGKGKLKYAFLGSVAEKLLRKSHRPVTVVPLDGRK
jgi:nucleotide-binding universal stress UspA family protein